MLSSVPQNTTSYNRVDAYIFVDVCDNDIINYHRTLVHKNAILVIELVYCRVCGELTFLTSDDVTVAK